MYEKFAELLEKSNKTAYQVAKETGIATSTLTAWNCRCSSSAGGCRQAGDVPQPCRTGFG